MPRPDAPLCFVDLDKPEQSRCHARRGEYIDSSASMFCTDGVGYELWQERVDAMEIEIKKLKRRLSQCGN